MIPGKLTLTSCVAHCPELMDILFLLEALWEAEFKDLFCLYLCMCACAVPEERPEEGATSSEVGIAGSYELPHVSGVLGFKLGSSVRAASALNY